MFGVAETKFVWYSYHYRNPDRSDQAIVLEHQARLAGRVLFRDRQDAGGLFVARWLVGAELAMRPISTCFSRTAGSTITS